MGTRIQMVGTTAGGTENNLASIDVPRNGSIVGCSWSTQPDLDTDNDSYDLQLSFGSVYSAANDARQVISHVAQRISAPTLAGFIAPGENFYDQIPDIGVSMGERLYVHGVTSATTVVTFFLMVSFSFDLDQALVRRR